MSDQQVARTFLLNSPIVSDPTQIINNSAIPNIIWKTFNVTTDQELSTTYKTAIGLVVHAIKIVNEQVTEYYTLNMTTNQGYGYDVNTFDVIEHYRYEPQSLVKYDPETNDPIQVNWFYTYNDLPAPVQQALVNKSWKDKIFVYAVKPYGTIVEYYS